MYAYPASTISANACSIERGNGTHALEPIKKIGHRWYRNNSRTCIGRDPDHGG
jgi:hypothetical protein